MCCIARRHGIYDWFDRLHIEQGRIGIPPGSRRRRRFRPQKWVFSGLGRLLFYSSRPARLGLYCPGNEQDGRTETQETM
jgi:hypothetical protein